MVDLLGNTEPLGGHINLQRCGARNAPGTCKHGCPDEYPFWGTTKENNSDKKENFENINVVEQPEIIEKFTVNDVIGHKENFMSGNMSIIVWVVLIIVLLGLGGFLFFTRNKNRLP